MTTEQFIALVRQMRQAQRLCFLIRSTEALQSAITLERMVDDELVRMSHPTLFEQRPDDEAKR